MTNRSSDNELSKGITALRRMLEEAVATSKALSTEVDLKIIDACGAIDGKRAIDFNRSFRPVESTDTKSVSEYTIGGVTYRRTMTRLLDQEAGDLKSFMPKVELTTARIYGLEKETLCKVAESCCLVCQLAETYIRTWKAHQTYLQSIAAATLEAKPNPKSPWARRDN